MEGRRRAGLLLVAVVAILALAVSATSGRLGGRPVPLPLMAAPSIGDCLLAVTGADSVADDPASGDPQPPEALTSGPCTGSRYGEITALVENPPGANRATPRTSATAATATSDLCDQATVGYVNGSGLGIDAAGRPGQWSSTMRITTLILRPSGRQSAAGQNWAACAAVQLDGSGLAARYAGSLKDVTTAGRLANLIGTCATGDLSSATTPVPCSRPHTVETFGFLYSDSETQSAAALRASCAGLIDRLAATALSGQAALQVEVDAVGPESAVAQGLVPHGNATCAVRSPRAHPLTGTLLGLGSRPIPWA